MSQADKRVDRRQRMLKDGKIITLNERSVIDCVIRDLSGTGAKLRCGDQTAVPNRFQLFVPQSRLFREARCIWRKGNEIGIRFIAPAQPAPPWTAKLHAG